jgi:hypothetical protein
MDYVMEAIETLKRYNDYQKSAINLKEEIIKLDEELKGSAITYSDMPAGGSGVLSDEIMINKICRKTQAEIELRETKFELNRIDRILIQLSDGEGNEALE